LLQINQIMDSIYQSLRIRDPLVVRQSSKYVHSSWSKKAFKYEGTVSNIFYQYINRGAPEFGKKKQVYIRFIDTSAYDNLLLQGSFIICSIRDRLYRCNIATIERDSNNTITKLCVSIYIEDDLFNLSTTIYPISIHDIDSMLITDETFDIKHL